MSVMDRAIDTMIANAVAEALAADEQRLRSAAAKVWGEGVWYGCDTAAHLADAVIALRERCERSEEARKEYKRYLREQHDSIVAMKDQASERVCRCGGASATICDRPHYEVGNVCSRDGHDSVCHDDT